MANNLLFQSVFSALKNTQGLIKIEITATAVAWYGAIVATTSVLISMLNYLRDRPEIKVKVSQGFLAYPDRPIGDVQLFIQAANTGRRPVTLSGVGFSCKNKEDIVIIGNVNPKLPFELTEGQPCRAWVNRKELVEELKRKKGCITSAWFRDATGKTYRTKYRLNYNA